MQPDLVPIRQHLGHNAALYRQLDGYWRAANYLSVGQIYLLDNPLLKEKLQLHHIKPSVVGHWGTTPGQNFIYTHLNRVIQDFSLNMIYVAGPGHGGPAVISQVYLEGTWTDIYPAVTQDEQGMRKLFRQFSFPGGVSSHVGPTTPGSIHEGGELGYSLSHAFGAVLDSPDLIVACVVGDGEAETGPLATAWQSSRFISPVTDGAVLPILHLNGYKISNPTLLARISHEDLRDFFKGCGWQAFFVEGDDPAIMHVAMVQTLDAVIESIRQIQSDARSGRDVSTRRWPMIVLRSPKGWTGPDVVDGQQIMGTFRSHQVPLLVDATHPAHVALLEDWMQSYRPADLFDDSGRLRAEYAMLAPAGERRMGANPVTNGGSVLKPLQLPAWPAFAVTVSAPGAVSAQDVHVLGQYLREVLRLNLAQRNFRLFGPDETMSNLLDPVFEVTSRQWDAALRDDDQYLAPSGMVMDAMLSEHQCEGWLEGYLLTGRHGIFNSYEAFIRIVDSMVTQHAKWLKVTAELPWRRRIASLNCLLTSHVWQQDHNGYTHQDPGFLNHVMDKKAGLVQVYLPPDANCLLATMEQCLKSRHHINVVVGAKHPGPQWLNAEQAAQHCASGLGIWTWAGAGKSSNPDLVLACCGDTPTMEILAAVMILREFFPLLNVRVINVVALTALRPRSDRAAGLDDAGYDALFTTDRPIIFAFHGYPSLIHAVTATRRNRNLHVHGYQDEGTVTTAFDMRVQNQLDRFHLVLKAVQVLPFAGRQGPKLTRLMHAKLDQHHDHIRRFGMDLQEILHWRWIGS